MQLMALSGAVSIATSDLVGSQTKPTELLPLTLLSIPAPLWQNILNGSEMETLSNKESYSLTTQELLQLPIAAAWSENTEELRTIKQENNVANIDRTRYHEYGRSLETHVRTAFTISNQKSAVSRTCFSDSRRFYSSNPSEHRIQLRWLQNKIIAERTRYANTQAQLQYMFNQLEGKPLE